MDIKLSTIMKEQTQIPGAMVIIDPEMPDAVLNELCLHWKFLASFLPRWCRRVNFYWSTHAEPGTVAEVVPNFTYRYASIYIYPSWLDKDSAFMRQQLLHEIIHLHIEPLAAYSRETFETLAKGEDKTLEIVKRELTHRVEMAMQDLSMTICEQVRRAES